VIAPGLWAALDDRDRQNRQNRQNVTEDMASVGFDSFGRPDTAAHQPEDGRDRVPEDAGMDQAQCPDVGPISAPAESEPNAIAPTEPAQSVIEGQKVITLLDRLIARKKLAESRHEI
jgi:hypothetical protein